MAWSFNPFTGNLDITGSSGAVVFEGEVATFADLPVTIGDPAVGAAFLVRDSTGVWLVNRRVAGIYIRRNNAGLSTDWEYAGDYPVNSVNGQSGNVVLGAADVGAAATSHTHAAADVTSGTFDNARINFAAPPAIGNTTPAAGAFTTLSAAPTSGSALTLTGGTVTASAPVIDATQTWNASGTTFTGFRLNVTNTASASASLIADWQLGGTSQMQLRRDGTLRVGSTDVVSYAIRSNNGGFAVTNAAGTGWNCETNRILTVGSVSSGVELRSGTTPTSLGVYATASGGTLAVPANWERLLFNYNATASAFRIDTDKTGTGVARGLELRTDGTTRLTFGSAGTITLNTTLACDAQNISTDTTTGTRIGTATSQKIGFFDKTPVVQPTAVADATDAATVITQLNALLSRVRDLGLIAT